jgi:HlyD family secretion protein
MKSKKKLIIAASVVIILGIIIIANVKKGGGVNVEASRVERGEIEEVVSAPGEISAKEERKINAEVTAEVVKLLVEEGDWVEKGQILVKLDSTEQFAAYQRAMANVGAQRADLEFKREQLRRKKELYEKGLISRENFENIATEVELASSILENARTELGRARRSLERTTIRSPIPGTVMDINKEEGEVVVAGTINNPGSIILTVSDLEEMEMVADVNESEIPLVSIRDTARITVDAFADTVFKGIVYYKASMPIETSSSQAVDFEVKISIPHHPGMLPGMSANCEIITAKKDSILRIPLQALVTKDKKSGVYKIKEGKTKFAEVKTGITEAMWVEIMEGLEENDLIVSGPIKTLMNLTDDQKVTWKEEKEEGSEEGESIDTTVEKEKTESVGEEGKEQNEKNKQTGEEEKLEDN